MARYPTRTVEAFGQPRDSIQLVTRHLDMQVGPPNHQTLLTTGDILDALDNNELMLKKLLDDDGVKNAHKILVKLKLKKKRKA